MFYPCRGCGLCPYIGCLVIIQMNKMISNAPRAACCTVVPIAHVHNACPALTNHRTSAAHVLHSQLTHAEQIQGTQDASALGANSCTWEGPAVQHMGSTARSPQGSLDPALTLTNCCTEFLCMNISLLRGCQIKLCKTVPAYDKK